RGRPAVGYLHERAGRADLRVVDHLFQRLHRRPPQILAVERDTPLVAGARREDLVEQSAQLARVATARLGGREPLVVDPLRALDGAAQVGPVPLALETDEPEPPAVAVAVAVDHRVAHRLARRDA